MRSQARGWPLSPHTGCRFPARTRRRGRALAGRRWGHRARTAACLLRSMPRPGPQAHLPPRGCSSLPRIPSGPAHPLSPPRNGFPLAGRVSGPPRQEGRPPRQLESLRSVPLWPLSCRRTHTARCQAAAAFRPAPADRPGAGRVRVPATGSLPAAARAPARNPRVRGPAAARPHLRWTTTIPARRGNCRDRGPRPRAGLLARPAGGRLRHAAAGPARPRPSPPAGWRRSHGWSPASGTGCRRAWSGR
jgi:hypothetical protein